MLARGRDEKFVQRRVTCWLGIICVRSKGRRKDLDGSWRFGREVKQQHMVCSQMSVERSSRRWAGVGQQGTGH